MDISRQVIGLAIEVHRQRGPGLPESAYQECLCQELRDASLPFDQQVALPIIYKGRRLDFEYKMDIVVEPGLVLEIRLFDVSSGMEDVEHGVDGRAEQVDDAREGSGVAIAPGASAGRLEQAIERLEAGVGVA